MHSALRYITATKTENDTINEFFFRFGTMEIQNSPCPLPEDEKVDYHEKNGNFL